MKNMDVKIIPLLISLALLVIFVSPLTMGVIFNIGNAVGIFVSGTMSLIFLFWKPFTELIKRLWENSVGKIFLSVVSVIIALCVILAIVISIFMIRASDDPPPDENHTVVVLGCKVNNDRPSIMLGRRLDCAYKYLSEHDSVKVVLR